MPDEQRKGLFGSRSGLVLLGFLAVGGYFLWTEHRAHVATVVPYLPFLLFLLCPLMHLFHGHGGHGNHEGHDHGTKSKGGDGQ
jgi:hypothetical protein